MRDPEASPVVRGPIDLMPPDGEASQPGAGSERAPDETVDRHQPGAEGVGVLALPARPRAFGAVAWARWSWRTLTSMRVALVLLALLALASVPGSLLPQRSAAGNPAAVRRFLEEYPTWGPLLDRLGFFAVYSSTWFAAIYLLLLVSMTGCVLPRCRNLWRAARSAPLGAPRNFARMPAHRLTTLDGDAATITEAAAGQLRRNGFRVATTGTEVSAEKGYLREVGNLGFHLSLLVLLLGMSVGALWGYEGRVIVTEGSTFANTVSAYDELYPGPFADPGALEPFAITLEDFDARFEPRGPQRGSPREFEAAITLTGADGSTEPRVITVNAPLNVGGTKAFLTGNGYAPRVTVRDGEGQVVLRSAVVFLPRDGNFTSTGVIKAPDALPIELGFEGMFLPTAAFDEQRGPYSAFPDLVDPRLLLTAWTGDLGLSTGVPQSVYRLDTSRMDQVRVGDGPLAAALRPGETLTLPADQGSITFDGVARFANFQIAADPGRGISLVAAILLLAGLTTSLLVRRRRVWVRVHPDGSERVRVEVCAQSLTRRSLGEDEIDRLLDSLAGGAATRTRRRTTLLRRRGTRARTDQ